MAVAVSNVSVEPAGIGLRRASLRRTARLTGPQPGASTEMAPFTMDAPAGAPTRDRFTTLLPLRNTAISPLSGVLEPDSVVTVMVARPARLRGAVASLP